MKKIFVPLMVFLAAFACLHAQQAKSGAVSYREPGAVLPPLRVIDTLGNEYDGKAFLLGRPFFLVMFNPTCGHCIDMGKLVGDSIARFRDNPVLFIAGAQMMPYLNSFYNATGLGNHQEIVVGIDSAKAVDHLYNYQTLPQINIYDKERRLQKIYYGDVPLDSLTQYVR